MMERKAPLSAQGKNAEHPLSASRLSGDGHQGRTHWPPGGAEAIKHFSQGRGQGSPPGWSHFFAGVFETCMSFSVWGPGRVTNCSGLPITEGVSGGGTFGFRIRTVPDAPSDMGL